MADDGLDELLRSSVHHSAEPGDPTGVADAVRSRVALGDVGLAGPAVVAPGFGGGTALGLLPWIGLVVVVGLVGGALGASGAVGHPTQIVRVSSVATGSDGTRTGSCPGGSDTVPVFGGQRVYAVSRTADDAFVGIREPGDPAATVWLARGVLQVGGDLTRLPIGGCGTAVVKAAPTHKAAPSSTPKPTTSATPTPKPKPKPTAPKPDTTPPVIGTIGVDVAKPCQPVITAAMTDNVGVTAAKITLGGATTANGTFSMTHVSGATWRYTPNLPSNTVDVVTIAISARDAKGNFATASWKFVGGCTIG